MNITFAPRIIKSIQKELKTGIEAENLAEVYGFLENYSS